MKLLDGKNLAIKMRGELKKRVESLSITPGLAVLLIGDDPASHVYVRNKERACESAGMKSFRFDMAADTPAEKVYEKIQEINKNPDIHGYLVQMPVPKQVDMNKVLRLIHPKKDADGLTPENLGLMLAGTPRVCPCTPHGVMKILKEYDIPLEGKKVAVIGRSNIVGKPMAALLTAANATVTVCHSRTPNTAEITSQCDVVVVAAGKPKHFGKEYFKQGAVVIDVGIHRLDEKLCGDVDFQAVKDHVSAITPVPGGVGPMTIAMLLENTYELAKESQK